MAVENGKLIVTVTHSKRTFPVQNAAVTVFDKNGKMQTATVTDISGRTPAIELYAPELDLSLSPGENPDNVAAYYTIKISADSFLEQTIENVPVYSGITSLQAVDLTYRNAMSGGNIADVTVLPFPNL